MTAATKRWLLTKGALTIVLVCAIIVVVSLGLSIYTIVRQANADAVAAADRKAKAVGDVSTCFQRVESTPKFLRVLGIIDTLAESSIISNQQALATQAPGDPLTKIRLQSLGRLIPARADLASYIKETERLSPTRAECLLLSEKLGVSQPKPKGTP